MGYTTSYTLTATRYLGGIVDPGGATPEESIADLVRTNEEAAYCLQPDGQPDQEGKWYEHVADLLAHSRENPHLLFTLEGEGEEPGDIWKKYFLNGRVQVEKATITIAPFDPAKLREPR